MKDSDKKGADDRLKESISAAMDGEASEIELRRVLVNMQNRDVCHVARRYQIIGDVMRKQPAGLMDVNLSERVSEQISTEPVYNRSKDKARWFFGRIGRVAVAASVACAVIIGMRVWHNPDSITQMAQHSATTANILAGDDGLAEDYSIRGLLAGSQVKQVPEDTGSARNIAALEALERLKEYSLNHAQQLAVKDIYGLLPLIRVVSSQSQ